MYTQSQFKSTSKPYTTSSQTTNRVSKQASSTTALDKYKSKEERRNESSFELISISFRSFKHCKVLFWVALTTSRGDEWKRNLLRNFPLRFIPFLLLMNWVTIINSEVLMR